MDKVKNERGEVAVLISPGYGAGWITDNPGYTACLFHPTIVQLVLSNNRDKITAELCRDLFGEGFYAGGAQDLEVVWITEGMGFEVDSHDGYETYQTIDAPYIA